MSNQAALAPDFAEPIFLKPLDGFMPFSSVELSGPVVVQHHGHLTLTLDFQGQILKMLYLRNRRADWHATKGMRLDRMLDPHCDFEPWPHPWPWFSRSIFFKSRNVRNGMPDWHGTKWIRVDRVFYLLCDLELWPWFWIKGQILKMLYLRNGRVNWHGTKGMWVNRILDWHYDFELWPHPWPWPWIFKVNFWNSCTSGTGGPINMERRGYESIGCYTYYMLLSYDFDLGFWRSNFKKALS